MACKQLVGRKILECNACWTMEPESQVPKKLMLFARIDSNQTLFIRMYPADTLFGIPSRKRFAASYDETREQRTEQNPKPSNAHVNSMIAHMAFGLRALPQKSDWEEVECLRSQPNRRMDQSRMSQSLSNCSAHSLHCSIAGPGSSSNPHKL